MKNKKEELLNEVNFSQLIIYCNNLNNLWKIIVDEESKIEYGDDDCDLIRKSYFQIDIVNCNVLEFEWKLLIEN